MRFLFQWVWLDGLRLYKNFPKIGSGYYASCQ